MSKSRIIAFTGTVGAGKSTQMRLLACKLKSKGVKVKITFLKSEHILAYLLELTLAKILIKREDVFPLDNALIEEKRNIFRELFKIWLILDLISISIKFLLGIYIPVKLGYTVLVEEYIPATIADYEYLSRAVGLSCRASSFASNFVLRLLGLGGQMQAVFLDADVDKLKSRWSRRRSPDEKPDYLRMQRTTLLSLLKRLLPCGLLYINTSDQTIEETNRLIVEFLAESHNK